jgi:hypothetical protein
MQKNGLADHCLTTGHTPDWNEAEIKIKENDKTKRKLKESIQILQSEPLTLNGDRGEMNHVWMALFKKQKILEESVIKFPPVQPINNTTEFTLNEMEFWVFDNECSDSNPAIITPQCTSVKMGRTISNRNKISSSSIQANGDGNGTAIGPMEESQRGSQRYTTATGPMEESQRSSQRYNL